MYSFSNWEIGNTIEYLFGNQKERSTITQIDYILLEDNNEYKLANNIIQAIGNSEGIFSYLIPWSNNGELRMLYEYKREGKLLYKNKNISSIENKEDSFLSIYNFPNGEIAIYINNPEYYRRLQLYDIQGKFIYSQDIGQKNEYFLSNLQEGIYIYELKSKITGGNKLRKLIIIPH